MAVLTKIFRDAPLILLNRLAVPQL